MPKVRKIAPGPNRFRIVQGTNISNKLLATMFFVVGQDTYNLSYGLLGHCKSARRINTKTRTNFKLTAITYCVKNLRYVQNLIKFDFSGSHAY